MPPHCTRWPRAGVIGFSEWRRPANAKGLRQRGPFCFAAKSMLSQKCIDHPEPVASHRSRREGRLNGILRPPARPHQYLRLRRLHLARRALASADATVGTVTQIANEYGFAELGRFAVLYRQLFGESPSVTLRRAPLWITTNVRRPAISNYLPCLAFFMLCSTRL
jgi:AraC-like DNA-binding protein